MVGADLRVQKSGPASGIVGQSVVHTFGRNPGQAVARDVILTDALPADVGIRRLTIAAI